jgi:hypothetical protein
MGAASDSGADRSSVARRVTAGRYTLEVGDQAGTAIVPTSPGGDPQLLTRAVAQTQKEENRKRAAPDVLEGAVEDASQVTSKIDRTVNLCTEIGTGSLDLKSISDEVDALVGLLQRLDRAGRWEEALRMARCLSMLLALAERWLALLRSLRIALHAAEQLGDATGKAWALHELGTLHVAAERHAEADRLLTEARELRRRCGDRHGLAMTDRNLQALCQTLRRLLHEPVDGRGLNTILRRPALALLAAGLLLAAGGTAGAMIERSGRSHRPLTSSRKSGSGRGGSTTGRSTRAGIVRPATGQGRQRSKISIENCPRKPVQPDSTVKVSGSIAPPQPDLPLTVIYTNPSRSVSERRRTNADGNYTFAITVSEPGNWSIRSTWLGNSSLLPAESEVCRFFVAVPTPPPPPTTSGEGTTTEPPPAKSTTIG